MLRGPGLTSPSDLLGKAGSSICYENGTRIFTFDMIQMISVGCKTVGTAGQAAGVQ